MPDPIAWTYAAGGEVAERLQFLTDVMHAPTGAEQRRSGRITPRINIQFDTMHSGKERRALEQLLSMYGAGEWLVPLIQDGAQVQTLAAPGSDTIEVDHDLLRFKVGGKILVMRDDPRDFEIATVEALAPGEITTTTPLTFAWKPGTLVTPLYLGRLDGTPVLPRFTGRDTFTRIEFRLAEPMPWDVDHGLPTYRTAPVLELLADWEKDPDIQHHRDIAEVDMGTGPVTTYDQAGIALALVRLQVALRTREEISQHRKILYALRGRAAPIWIPSQSSDLEPVADLTNGTSYIDVEWTGISGWVLQENHRDLRIELVDGTILYRRITATSETSETTERLTLDAAWPSTIPAGQVALVSFMTLARQEADVNLLRYWSRDLVQTEMAFRGFKHGL